MEVFKFVTYPANCIILSRKYEKTSIPQYNKIKWNSINCIKYGNVFYNPAKLLFVFAMTTNKNKC